MMPTPRIRPMWCARWFIGRWWLAAPSVLLAGCPMPPVGNGNDNGNGNVNDNVNENVNGAALSTFETTNFSGAGNCALCHNNLSDSVGNDVSIPDEWRATMMAAAAKDPFFLASVEAEVNHAPGLAATIEDTCANCHMPMAYTQANANGEPTRIFGDGFLSPANALHEAAMEGVSCTLCHQIRDTFARNPEDSFSGGFEIDTAATAPDRPIFGPYENVQSPDVMQTTVGYVPQFGAHILDAALCATCHTLFTPTLDAEGNIVGEFPEQTPFEEWRLSNFGDGVGGDDRTCQDCHMPLADGAATISAVPANLDPREPFYRHVFRGANVTMLKLLRDNIEALGLVGSTVQFNDQIALTEAFLQNETATIEIAEAIVDGDTLEVDVVVTNLAGHKFPTSFPSRRAWIHLVVLDATGAVVFVSGQHNDDGSIVGANADTEAGVFEPHHDEITSEDQVQIYEPIMQNTDGQVTYTLLRAAVYAKDNRLLPAGMTKQEAINAGTVAVAGAAVGDDDFMAGSDEVGYLIDVTGRTAPFTVTAQLLYQSISYRFAEELLSEEGAEVERFRTMFEPADKTPTVIDTAETTAP